VLLVISKPSTLPLTARPSLNPVRLSNTSFPSITRSLIDVVASVPKTISGWLFFDEFTGALGSEEKWILDILLSLICYQKYPA